MKQRLYQNEDLDREKTSVPVCLFVIILILDVCALIIWLLCVRAFADEPTPTS